MSTLPTVLVQLIRAQLAGLRVGLPGRVVAYDPEKQRADVQPLVQDGTTDEDGERITKDLPILTDVPVCFPGAGVGASAWRLTFPIKVGDTVELRFMSSSIARWKLTGGGTGGKPVDPGDDRHHALPDAIAVPDLHDYAHVPTTAPTNAMVLHGAIVKIGGPTGTEKAIKGETFLDALALVFDSLQLVLTPLAALPGMNATVSAFSTVLETFQSALVQASLKTTNTEVK